jgi:hypothetical protein
MKIVNTGSSVFFADGQRIEPFDLFDVSPTWLANNSSHRLKTPDEYREMLEGLGRRELQKHIKMRREASGEDLSASGSAEELRARLRYDVED